MAWQATTHRVRSTVPGITGRRITVIAPAAAPPGGKGARRRHPVLYLHDGQNCFDQNVFGAGGWRIQHVVPEVVAAGLMAPVIVVAVDNAGTAHGRKREYVPGAGAPPGRTADGYLDYLERDVIPFVEARYPAQPGPAGRCVGGSSYGGLISLYAGWTRPHLFGRVMAMSTAFHFPLHALVRDTRRRPPLRLYLDAGTTDYEGGDDGLADTAALRDLLLRRGFALGRDLAFEVGEGDTHDEEAWSRRLPRALPFLFPAGLGARSRARPTPRRAAPRAATASAGSPPPPRRAGPGRARRARGRW